MDTNHEIALDEFQLVSETFLLRISCGALNLVVIVVETGDMGAGEFGNLAGWSSYTAANIEDFVSILNTNLGGEVVFVSGNGLVEGLPVCESAEVERLAPSVFVEISSQVVVTILR